MNQDVSAKLCKDFKISPETCERYEKLYAKTIEPNMRLRYLSHLVSTIEDMINDNFKKKYILPVLNSKKYTEEDKRVFIRRNFRLYSILLRPLEGLHGKGYVTHYNFGSIIVYNPRLDDKDIRVLIAHELGHIINRYWLNNQDTQNTANLFSFIAINGKNNFYKNEATGFTYTSELAIIDAISTACPILRHEQAADV